MRALICCVITGLIAAAAPVHAGQGRGNGNFKSGRSADNRESAAAVDVKVVFAPRDVEVIRAHYRPQYRSLPPGLQKKVARGKPLPPGWQKKMEPFPASLDRVLVPLPGGYHRGVYEGHAVIYHPITHAILDVFSIF